MSSLHEESSKLSTSNNLQLVGVPIVQLDVIYQEHIGVNQRPVQALPPFSNLRAPRSFELGPVNNSSNEKH